MHIIEEVKGECWHLILEQKTHPHAGARPQTQPVGTEDEPPPPAGCRPWHGASRPRSIRPDLEGAALQAGQAHQCPLFACRSAVAASSPRGHQGVLQGHLQTPAVSPASWCILAPPSLRPSWVTLHLSWCRHPPANASYRARPFTPWASTSEHLQRASPPGPKQSHGPSPCLLCPPRTASKGHLRGKLQLHSYSFLSIQKTQKTKLFLFNKYSDTQSITNSFVFYLPNIPRLQNSFISKQDVSHPFPIAFLVFPGYAPLFALNFRRAVSSPQCQA